MSKVLKSRVENVYYRDVPDYWKLEVSGWAFYTDETPFHYEVAVNGQQILPSVVHQLRKDVMAAYDDLVTKPRIGFFITIPYDKPIHSLKITTSEGDTILKLNDEQLKKDAHHSMIHYNLDAFKHGTTDADYTASGWAVSADEMPVTISITDSEGNAVKADCRQTNRPDLVDMGIVSRGAVQSGFYVQFHGEPDKSYKLVMQAGEHIKKIPLTASKNTGFGLVKAYFKALNPLRMKLALRYLKKHGVKRFIKRITVGPDEKLTSYPYWFKDHSPSQADLEAQRGTRFSYAPKISLIVAAYNTPEAYLAEMIDSVRNQTYGNWELCIGDGSTNDKVEKYVAAHYSDDPRIKYRKLEKNYGISGNMNGAYELATGDYVSLFDHDDLLTEDCLYEVVKSLQETRWDVVYTDEDKLNDATKELMDPHFKPDFAADQLNSHNYITHFLTVNKKIIDKTGFMNSEYDGSQDHDFILRVSEQTSLIHHIPKVLYHWRMHMASTAMNPESKMYCYTAGVKAVQAHLDRMGIKGKCEMLPAPLYGMYRVIYETPGDPLVSIIIPSKDESEFLKRCVDSIYAKSDYPNFEILVVENNSTKPETFQLYEALQKEHPNLRVITWDKPFNYSAINNFAVSQANGDYFLFLNNDTELIEPGSIRDMLGYAMQKEIGAVGAKLLYPDDLVQHAGVVLGYNGYAAHAFTEIDRNDPGHMCRPLITADYSAVTAACLMVSRKDFEQVNGFDESFAVACNDVDFCLKLLKLGRRNVMTPFSLWYHYESRTRGSDRSGESLRRFEQEVARFQKKWPEESKGPDPFHNVNFDLDTAPFYFEN